MSHSMVMQVFMDLYLHRTFLLLPMQILGPPLVRNIIFIFVTYSCLLHPPHLMRIYKPSSKRWIISFACIWHIIASRLALTSHVFKSIHHNSHTSLLTSIREPPRFACLCRDLSRACIGMFESHLLCPYYADDLWTTVHHPDMGHRLCHCNQLTILEFLLSSFLTPKKE